MKNLVFGAKVIHRFQLSGTAVSDVNGLLTKGSQGDESIETATGDHGDSLLQKAPAPESSRDLSWLINRLSRLARFEAGHHTKEARKVWDSISCKATLIRVSFSCLFPISLFLSYITLQLS